MSAQGQAFVKAIAHPKRLVGGCQSKQDHPVHLALKVAHNKTYGTVHLNLLEICHQSEHDR